MASYPVEADKRLSKSSLWAIQQNYFNERGVDAWNNEVPFFISSNAFIANRYAQMCIQYAQDIAHTGKKLYIIEVGAGPGKFTFYFLKAFERSCEQLHNFDYQYILTDVATKNVEFCKENVTLKPLIEKGKLDFGIYDASGDDDFELLNAKQRFSDLAKDNHVIFICNYLFDTIEQDFFQFQGEELQEVQVSLSSRYESFDAEKPKSLRELSLTYKSQPITGDTYYDNPALNRLLFDYPKFFEDRANGAFLFPIGAMRFFDKMSKICDKYLVICGDLGHANVDELKNLHAKNCHIYEGCICYMLNFHALGEYVKTQGGDALLTQHRNSYKICLYSHGQSFDDLVRTRNFFLDEMESMGGDEFCYMNDEFAVNNYRYTMKACLSFLRMSCYEPDTYFHMHDKLIDEFDELNDNILQDLRQALIKVEQNLYHYQGFYDVFSLLGMLHLKLKRFKHAEKLFKMALKYSKNPFIPLRSLGLLYDERGNSNMALNYYKKALTYDKKDFLCKSRISILEGSPSLVIKPILKALLVFGLTVALIYLALIK